MIQILPRERWPELAEIFKTEFEGSDLPGESAMILAEVDETGAVQGFMVCEALARVGQIWRSGPHTREMLKWLEGQIPPGTPVIAIASEERFEGLCRAFQMREVPGKVFRRDF